MPLSNVRLSSAKPASKPYKLADEKGPYLLVHPAGHKWWRLKYRFGARSNGKPGKAEKMLALGVYPAVSLKRAREKRDAARALLADGIDPAAQRKVEVHSERLNRLHTFEAVAGAWMKRGSLTWSASHALRTRRRFERHVFPWIGKHPVKDVKRADMREVLRRIETTRRIETAYRVLQLCRAVFEYANNERSRNTIRAVVSKKCCQHFQ